MVPVQFTGGPLKSAGWQSLEPMGDQGVIIRFATEEKALAWARVARRQLAWEIVPAYRAVAVYAPLTDVGFDTLTASLALVLPQSGPIPGRRVEIPCCYRLGPDLTECAELLKMTPEDLEKLHASTEYQVYAIGFVPGFPYMGWLPDAITGIDRLESPRTRVPPGSVGITGRQTGIYPAEVPGGWRLIGKTPCMLVDLAAGESGWFALAPGDRVRFRPIHEIDFDRLNGSHPTVLEPNP